MHLIRLCGCKLTLLKKLPVLSYQQQKYFSEIDKCFNDLSYDSNCRAIVLSANGKHFTAGLDLMDAMKFGQELAEFEDVARKANFLEQKIKAYQV